MRFILIIAVLIMWPAMASAEISFFQALPDVPVAEGLQLLPDQDVVFDKPDARIVETVSVMEAGVADEAVRGFYQRNLPAFGWQALPSGDYSRSGEVLKLWFEVYEGQKFFHLRIEPSTV